VTKVRVILFCSLENESCMKQNEHLLAHLEMSLLFNLTYCLLLRITNRSHRTFPGASIAHQILPNSKTLTTHLVSWNWNGNHPSGTVGEVKAGEVTVTSHRGNEISKTGDESNPAVHIERSGNDVVKTANELKIESKASGSEQNGKIEKKDDEKTEEKATEDNEEAVSDDAKTGEKRKADEKVDAEAEKEDEEQGEKKQKTTNGDANGTTINEKKDDATKNGNEKKKAGRPKGPNSAPKKEKKEPTVGKAARKTRSQGAA
jgi:hypothetical protein